MADWWTDRPWRLIQTNLREIDMADIDAERYVADLRAFAANVAMINAAGIIASYPTKLPFHYQSPYLTGDSLQDILAACHDADIRVIARTDFSKVRRPIHEQHPDWAYRTAGGDIVDYNGDVHACLAGQYQQVYALRIMEELLTTHDFDGIFFNMGGFQTRDYSGNHYGPCHCDACRRGFREACGMDVPTADCPDADRWRAYERWKARVAAEHGRKVVGFLTELKPGLCIANHTAFRRGFIRQESNTALGRPLPHWQYSASENTRWARGTFPEMVSSNTTVDFIDYPARHVAVSPAQQRLRLAQNLAAGGGLDYYLIGRLDNHADRSGFRAVKEMFHYHAAHEAEYIGLESAANVALIGGGGGEFRGWFRVLVEGHWLFDVLRPHAAADVSWDRYDALVLPEAGEIDATLAERVVAFVAGGGALVATGPPAEPLATCLGIERILHVRQDARSAYFRIDRKAAFPHLAQTDLVYLAGPCAHAEHAPQARLHGRFIPPHNFGPPERCYYEQITGAPAVTVHPHGSGRAVWVPWLPGALYNRQGHTNTFDFARDVLAALAGVAPVGGNLPPMVEVTLHERRDGSGAMLHLVNGSGHFGNSFFEPVPMKDLAVRLARPRGVAAARSLPNNADYTFDATGGDIAVHIPELHSFDAIRMDYT